MNASFGPPSAPSRPLRAARAGAAVVLFALACVASAPAAARRSPSFSAPDEARLQVPEGAGRHDESAPFDLPSDELNVAFDRATRGLVAWFVALGEPGPKEDFGAYVVRGARLMLGRPYGHTVEVPGQEVVDCDVSQFQCESYVESSLAVARCGWLGEPSVGCYRREVARMRYRHGAINGFGSRLHYFEDWLEDNALRGSLTLYSARLGGKKVQRSTAYMTDHAQAFPALQDANELRQVQAAERRLSHRSVDVVMRHEVAAAERALRNGDIVAIVTRRPDILVHHAGLVERDEDGSVHLLHASSAHHHVMRTPEGIGAYLARRPERQGMLVARPTPPTRRAPPPATKRSAARARPGARVRQQPVAPAAQVAPAPLPLAPLERP